MGCVKYLKNVTVLDNEQIICCNDKTSEKTDPDGDSEFFDALAQQAVDFKGVSNKHVASAILKEQTKLKFNEIINLTKDQRDGKAASEPGSSSMKQTVSAGVEDHSGGEWKKVERKPRRNNVVIGNRDDTNIKGVPKYTYLHVYRIDKETTVESLTALLANHFPEVICESITPKHPEMYSSFRIGIYDRNFRKAMDPSIWPSGACCANDYKFDNLFIDLWYANIKVICITVTWCTPDMISLLHITNFTLASSYSRSNFKGGGTAIYVKSGLAFNDLGLYDICIEKEFEICGISSEIAGLGKTIILCCYRSPNSNCNVFIECVTDILYDLYKSSHTLFLLGDFNIDPIRDKREFAKLCNVLNVFGLTPRVKWPTRVTNNAASTIDNIFSNCSTKSASLAVDNNISDHRTVLFDCEDNVQQVKCHTMNFMRSFSDQATQNFISDISTEDWLQVYNSNNMNIAYSHFHGIFSFYFEKHFPKHRKNCRPANSNPWINEKIIESSEKLKDLHYMKLDNPRLYDYYKREKLKHKKLINRTKKQVFQEKISQSDNPTKTAWHTIHHLLNRNKNKQRKEITIVQNGTLISNNETIAQLFNDYFLWRLSIY
nr:unnamed protein product [Callosobruchus chinensis]